MLLVAACSSSDARKSDSGATPAPSPEAGARVDAARPDAAPPTRVDAAPPTQDSSTKPPTPEKDAATSGPRADAAIDAAGPAQPPPKNCVGTNKLDSYVSDPKLCVYTFAQNVPGARQLAFAPNGDLFVSNGRITVLWDTDKNGTSDSNERATFAQASGLNHGLVFSRDHAFLYASSGTTVFRWAYTSGQRMAQGESTVVVKGIDGGGHDKRPLGFDSKGRLIVSVGSAGNVDTAEEDWAARSQIRRFTLPAAIPSGGLEWMSGELIASGMRNESGIFVDADDRIWGVENGRDNLEDDDLGGDIHNDNPGEEINLIDGVGTKFYGYPLCYSEFMIGSGGGGRGTQWADQTLPQALQKTDAFCKDTREVRPPAFLLPAHWAPLGVIRYTGRSLPMTGDLIVGAHGSWNRAPATGRVVARVRFEGDKLTTMDILVGEKDGSGQLRQGSWNVRPVDVRQGPDEAIYVSDDLGGRVLKIGYDND